MLSFCWKASPIIGTADITNSLPSQPLERSASVYSAIGYQQESASSTMPILSAKLSSFGMFKYHV